MTVIGKKRVRELQRLHADAGNDLGSWYLIADRSIWGSLIDVRRDFPSADQYGKVLIFNIRHNTYRLVTKVDFRSKLLMIKDLLNHKEYEKGGWKKWA